MSTAQPDAAFRLPSGSSLYRADRCPASMVLPQGPDKQGKAADRGNEIHAFVERAVKTTRAEALAFVSEELRRTCERLDLEAIPPGIESEVAFGLHPETFAARRYEMTEKRRYPQDRHLHLTLDLVGCTDTEAVVIDLKTGAVPVYAENNLQLKAGALAACRVSGRKRARVAIFTLLDSGEWIQDWATLNEFEVADIEDELRSILDRIRAAASAVEAHETPEMEAGPHCRFCRCAPACPLQTGLIRAAYSDAAIDLALMTPTQIGKAWERLGLLESLIERAKDAFQLHVEQNGEIPLPSGQVLRMATMDRPKVADGAAEYVAKTWGPDVLAAASTLKLSALATEQVRALEEAGLVTSAPTKAFLKAVGRKRAIAKAEAA